MATVWTPFFIPLKIQQIFFGGFFIAMYLNKVKNKKQLKCFIFFEYEELRDETGAKRRSATSCVDLRHPHPSNFKIGFFLSYNKLRAAAPRAARRSRRVAPQGRKFFCGAVSLGKLRFFGWGGDGFSRPSSLFPSIPFPPPSPPLPFLSDDCKAC